MPTIEANPAINPRILITRSSRNEAKIAECNADLQVYVTTKSYYVEPTDDYTSTTDYIRVPYDPWNLERTDAAILAAVRSLHARHPELPLVSNIERFIGLGVHTRVDIIDSDDSAAQLRAWLNAADMGGWPSTDEDAFRTALRDEVEYVAGSEDDADAIAETISIECI